MDFPLNDIIYEYENGYSLKQLEKRWGWSETYIYRQMKIAGVKMRPVGKRGAIATKLAKIKSGI